MIDLPMRPFIWKLCCTMLSRVCASSTSTVMPTMRSRDTPLLYSSHSEVAPKPLVSHFLLSFTESFSFFSTGARMQT